MNLTNFSLNKPYCVLLFWAFILFFGYKSFEKLPAAFMDKGKFVSLSLDTIYLGAPKEKVLDVTKALEEALLEFSGVDSLYSTTQNQVSSIKVNYKIGVTESEAIAKTFVSISEAKSKFPQGVSEPVLRILGEFRYPLFTLAATSDLPLPEFYDFAVKQIKPNLAQLPGVSHVKIVGERQNQATICLDLDKLREHEMSVSEVYGRLQDNGTDVIVSDDIKYFLTGEYSSLQEIGSIPIRFLSNDKLIKLSDVADIRLEESEPICYGYYNKKRCLFLEVYSAKSARLFVLEKAFAKQLKKLQNELELQKVSLVEIANRENCLFPLMSDFSRNTLLAIAAAIAIIWFTFRDLSSILVSVTSIPTALCGTFLCSYYLGYSLNIFTVLALIVSIGLIIDDMIIIRENIFRHLEEGKSPFEATRRGVKEMSQAIFGTSCMIFSVAIPMIIIPPTPVTQHLSVFGVTLLVAMAFSLLESLTLGPLLCAYCLGRRGSKEVKVSIFQRCFDFSLKFVKEHPIRIIFGCMMIFVMGISLVFFVHLEGDPSVPTGDIVVHTEAPQGIPFEAAHRKALQFSNQIVSEYQDVENLAVRIEKTGQTFYIKMVEKNQRKISAGQLAADLEKKLEELTSKGTISSYYVLGNILYHFFYFPDFSLELSSYDGKAAYEYSRKMLNLLRKEKCLTNIEDSTEVKQVEQSISLNFPQMSLLGVELNPVTRELDGLLNIKELAAEYHPPYLTDATRQPIKIKTSMELPNLHELKKRAYVPNINNTLIPLRSIADKITETPSAQILRKNGKNVVVISGAKNSAYHGVSPMRLSSEAMENDLPIPEGISMSWADGSRASSDMSKAQPLLGGLVISLIYFVLIVMYQSITIPLVILLPLPLSFVGSLFALWLTGNSINSFSIIGIMLPIGIAAKNGIVLITYTYQLIQQGISPSDAVFQAARVRFRPIIMTTMGVFLTTLPILLSTATYTQLQTSLGIAIFGGLFSSILTSLYLIPAAFKYTYKFYKTLHDFFLQFLNNEQDEGVM